MGCYIRMDNRGGIISTEEIPGSSTRALWQSYQDIHLVAKQEELAKRNDQFCLTKCHSHTSKGSLGCRKILRHGADSFTSSPKEGVTRICVALGQIQLQAC
jgi:hypothetical protein